MRPLLATASYDETIRIWDCVDQRQIESFTVKDTQTNVLAVSPNGQQLAAAGYQCLRLFDSYHLGNQPLLSFNVHDRNVTAMGFSNDGSFIFTGSEDQTTKIWDYRVNQVCCQRILQLNSTVNSIVLHPNDVELIVADSTGGIFIWDIRTNRDDALYCSLEAAEFVNHLDIDKYGQRIVAITNQGRCIVYSINPGSHSLLGPDPNVFAEGELNPDPFGATSAPMHHLHSDHGPKPFIFQPHKQYGLKCRFSPDGTSFVTTAGDDVPKLWDLASKGDEDGIALKQSFYGEPITRKNKRPQELAGFNSNKSEKSSESNITRANMKWIWDCAFTKDSSKLFTVGTDSIMRLFDVKSGEVLRRYLGHSKGISAMCFYEPDL